MSRTKIRRDTTGRRTFASHSNRIQWDYEPNEMETEWLRFLNIHGFASSELLFELTRHMVGGGYRNDVTKKILAFWETGFIYRPDAQQYTRYSQSHFGQFAVAEPGQIYMEREGMWENALMPTGNYPHQIMTAYITGSCDILCRRNGYRFIPAHEYLNGRPISANVPFTFDGKIHTLPLIPDSVFAIDYGNNSYITYIVEADRNTKALTSTRWDRNTDQRNIRQYANFIGKGQYKTEYSRDSMAMLLYVTVSAGHAQTFIDLVGEELGSPKYIAVGVVPEFKSPFKPPRLLTHIFDGPLIRAGREPWTIKKEPLA